MNAFPSMDSNEQQLKITRNLMESQLRNEQQVKAIQAARIGHKTYQKSHEGQ